MSDEHWVYVVDDDEAMRESLQWLIESDGMRVRTFGSADAFLSACEPGWSGCLLLDVRMPGMSGLELQAYLSRRSICLPVIVITGHGDVAMAVRAMKAGALDFIEKPFNDDALLGSIRRALETDDRDRVQRSARSEIQSRMTDLTPREHEVMDMVVEGQSNREIATALSVSIKTVEVHRARVMDKMQADSLADLVRMAIMANTP
ncbi:response regulator FixJ [Thiorhodovibrio frisius]|uniref:Response regulator n=1 Tax=Thiorhodovibrio frisius TaxID=631362 RepID=H8Z2W4_9GAMM|nr:response regulator FixJ [Thiorhodovibrio frisius]EIC21700.1 response regulator [Thiorhodovibrio frisius]WPL21668.1 Transcriptional regulatory protein FixJ [Thiorhodovibrio frisius]